MAAQADVLQSHTAHAHGSQFMSVLITHLLCCGHHTCYRMSFIACIKVTQIGKVFAATAFVGLDGHTPKQSACLNLPTAS